LLPLELISVEGGGVSKVKNFTWYAPNLLIIVGSILILAAALAAARLSTHVNRAEGAKWDSGVFIAAVGTC
jgi:hypothetical protein